MSEDDSEQHKARSESPGYVEILKPLDENDRQFINVFIDKRLMPVMEEQQNESRLGMDEIQDLWEKGRGTREAIDRANPSFTFNNVEELWREYHEGNPQYKGPVTIKHIGAELCKRLDDVMQHRKFAGEALSSKEDALRNAYILGLQFIDRYEL